MNAKHPAIGLAVLAVPLLSAAIFGQAAADDEKKLQGEWTVISMDVFGKSVPADKLPKAILVVKGDLWQKPVGEKRVQFRFKLHADKDPKQIDINGAGATWPAIYNLAGDVLTVCEAQKSIAAGGKRPTEFKAGETIYMTVFKRKESK
jgi:uncharacterized protein (TIGR03067 family)